VDLHAAAMIALNRPQGRARDALIEEIDRAIEPFDIAGLLDRSRRDWYPVLADDLMRSAGKLGAGEGDVQRLLARCGFDSAFKTT
jgi:FADH2 O2-dependent halogenase